MTKARLLRPQITSWRPLQAQWLIARVATLPCCHQPPEWRHDGCSDQSCTVCDSSQAFVVDTKSSRVPLMVCTTGEAPSGLFIVPTLVTDVRNRQDTRSTVTFESRPTVNQRLMEIASSTVATTVSNHEDRHTGESQGTSVARPTQSSTSSSDQHSSGRT